MQDNRAYFSLSAVSGVLILINLVDVFYIEQINAFKKPYIQYIVLCVPPAAIIILWTYIMLNWGYNNFKNVPSQWNHATPAVKRGYSQLLLCVQF
jgi:hypothetical protein